jgi:hypothetical protein
MSVATMVESRTLCRVVRSRHALLLEGVYYDHLHNRFC